MRLLLANDDGIGAPGLLALEAELGVLGCSTTVAPQVEQSAKSHALTLYKPLRLSPAGKGRWAVSGTPADCVYMGLNHILADNPPDLVVAGINDWANLGDDVFYSGTVAAAREAALHGFSAMAVSIHREGRSRDLNWQTAAAVARSLVLRLYEKKLPDGCFLNVNVPNIPLAQLRGIRTTRLGRRIYKRNVDVRLDPRGREYYWIGGPFMEFADIEGSDGAAVQQDFASVTPMQIDCTAYDVRDWTQGAFDGVDVQSGGG